MRPLREFAQRVSRGARQNFDRVQDALLRHSPDGPAADTQHLGGLLLSHQELFIDRDGREPDRLAVSIKKALGCAPFCSLQQEVRCENRLEERVARVVHGGYIKR
jgi:hypothetical protein